MPSRTRQPESYWKDLSYTLRSTHPKRVHLFCRDLDELEELARCLSESFERSKRPWWIEARLALYEIHELRAKRTPDQHIVDRLRTQWKRLSFLANAEGRAKAIQSPFFERKSTVMCVNGVVATVDGLAFQACTLPSREDRDEGLIIHSLQAMSGGDTRALVGEYPLVNRARVLVTPNLETIPMEKRRPDADWFAKVRSLLRARLDYPAKRRAMERLLDASRHYLHID